jgi:succinyl-diaminopimelate desuccinylase
MISTLELAQQLIACASVTPEDAGCQNILIQQLSALGFTIERLVYENVTNFWARRGTEGPLFVFAGHTDVVPTGPVDQWTSPPFVPTLRDGFLYGRGVADMKGGVAAMITSCRDFIQAHPHHKGSIGFLITGDEEGLSIHGTAKVIEHLNARNEKIDWCLIGEPTSDKQLGDTLKNGRRGTLSGCLKIFGKQGHVAYPHLADNPIHKAMPALSALTHALWDKGNEFFPATQFQISNIHAGTGAGNVIPGEIIVDFNFRYSPEVTAEQLKYEVDQILKKYHLNYQIEWSKPGLPFFTAPGELVDACCEAIREISGIEPTLSTSGGTSDGRFIAPTGAQVIELGLCNHTIHQINESVKVDDLETLSRIYCRILQHLLG